MRPWEILVCGTLAFCRCAIFMQRALTHGGFECLRLSGRCQMLSVCTCHLRYVRLYPSKYALAVYVTVACCGMLWHVPEPLLEAEAAVPGTPASLHGVAWRPTA